MITPLLAKVFHPLLRSKETSLFASMSAKVGSIEDNHLGGWYGYRASKAALNMFIKNISLEFSRHNIPCVVLSIHPGTTETSLSKSYIARSKLKIHSPAALLNIIGNYKRKFAHPFVTFSLICRYLTDHLRLLIILR